MTKEIAAKQTTEIAAAEMYNANEWGSTFSSEDIVFPRLVTVQSQSKFIDEMNSKVGDIVHTLTKETLGGYDKPIKILPFYMQKHWLFLKVNGGDFAGIEKDVGQRHEMEEVQNGEPVKCYHQYSFFCFTEDDAMPCIISFKSTAHKVGRDLAMFMYHLQPQAKKTPASNWLSLSVTKATSKKNGKTYALPSFKVDRASTKDELSTCLQWIRTINSKEVNYADTTDAPSQEFASDATPF